MVLPAWVARRLPGGGWGGGAEETQKGKTCHPGAGQSRCHGADSPECPRERPVGGRPLSPLSPSPPTPSLREAQDTGGGPTLWGSPQPPPRPAPTRLPGGLRANKVTSETTNTPSFWPGAPRPLRWGPKTSDHRGPPPGPALICLSRSQRQGEGERSRLPSGKGRVSLLWENSCRALVLTGGHLSPPRLCPVTALSGAWISHQSLWRGPSRRPGRPTSQMSGPLLRLGVHTLLLPFSSPLINF